MGFYAPAQIVRDACEHGVEVRPVCINVSRWDCSLEPVPGQSRFAVRLGFRLVKGLGNAEAAELVAARGGRPFSGVEDLRRRTRLAMASLETLARADAFLPAFGLERRDALWAIRALGDTPLPLFAAADEREESRSVEVEEPAVALRPMTAGAAVVQDYRQLGLSLRAHPLAFLRGALQELRVDCCSDVRALRDGARAETAGLVLVRQRPGSAKGWFS
ncbi:helix-hairpin-helix domain-containing protein [Fodinicurvata halophila]